MAANKCSYTKEYYDYDLGKKERYECKAEESYCTDHSLNCSEHLSSSIDRGLHIERFAFSATAGVTEDLYLMS